MNGRLKGSLLVVVAAALLCSAGALDAQSRSSRAHEKGGIGYFLGGIGWMLESGEASLVGSTGGGGASITNRWVLGGEGHSSFGSSSAGGYGFLNLGYAVVAEDFVLVYPLVGLGGGAVTSAIDSSVSKCALLNPSIAVDFLLPLGKDSGILLGLHAGYTFSVYSNTFDWSMPHLRLALGGYGFGD
jgi:hypothetical protein